MQAIKFDRSLLTVEERFGITRKIGVRRLALARPRLPREVYPENPNSRADLPRDLARVRYGWLM